MTSERAVACRVRVIHFCPWAGALQDAREFLDALPQFDVRARVARADDARLVQMARLDCDWHGENVRAFAALEHERLEFLPAWTVGVGGLLEVLSRPRPADEEWWFVLTGQHAQQLGSAAGRVLSAYERQGVRILYYAFDEASRTVANFCEVAPHLSVFVHDEFPLEERGKKALRSDCLTIHRSWVANVVPFAGPFEVEPEEKIVFLGSKLGLTPHRERQIGFLQKKFRDRFTAICDHSLPVGDRLKLGRYKVSLCPEGRKFTTRAMSQTHTDRPFWSGCLGMVPVSENSATGGRLESLHQDGLIVRYSHGDLKGMAEACERALAMPVAERRRVYEHFNRCETVGRVVADAIASRLGQTAASVARSIDRSPKQPHVAQVG